MTTEHNIFFEQLQKAIPEEAFSAWFQDTRLELLDGKPVLLARNNLAVTRIHRQYHNYLNQISENLWGQNLEIAKSNSNENTATPPQNDPKPTVKTATFVQKTYFKPHQPHFTFERFVVDKNNQIAYLAAKDFFTHGHLHSPLLIIGDHGQGKSHLASALASQWEESQVLYMNAESFTYGYGQASYEGKRKEFLSEIRSKSLLVVEDLDFLLKGDKAKTIEELSETLKHYMNTGKRLVLTSKSMPNKYLGANRSLGHILISGFRVRLEPPGESARLKIAQNELKVNRLEVPAKTLQYMASLPFHNVREVIGAVRQISGVLALGGDTVEKEQVRDLLSDYLNMTAVHHEDREDSDLHQVAKVCAEHFGVSMKKLLSTTRERHISLARHYAMALSIEMVRATLSEVGMFYGGRRHQTVLSARNKVRKMRAEEPKMQKVWEQLKLRLLKSD